MAKKSEDRQEEVKQGVSTLQAYAALAQRRQEDRDAKIEAKRLEREAREQEQEENPENPEVSAPKSKKEKAQDAYDAWKSTLVGITENDLIYTEEKKKGKRYKSWIVEDLDSGIIVDKSKKKKNENYNKKFEPTLNMLQSLVSDQNRFTQDLSKRYMIMAGPANKNALPLNKTLVELAGVINTSRSNSLGLIKEISSTHAKIADLYMKQRKENREINGTATDAVTQDLGIMGSEIVKGIFGDPSPSMETPVVIGDYNNTNQSGTMESPMPVNVQPTHVNVTKFDPATWNPVGIDTSAAYFESIPHKFVVELTKATGVTRFIAIRNDNGEELPGCPAPATKVKTIKEDTMTASDDFDQIYELRIV